MTQHVLASKKRVLDLHRMNYSAAEIAESLGLTKARVYQLLAELKRKPNAPTRGRERSKG
jgi:DNA-binding CsgD family transcriptional regulator